MMSWTHAVCNNPILNFSGDTAQYSNAYHEKLSASLILFDIDGTLTRGAGPHHRAALEAAILQVTGRTATTQGIPVHGMLDHVILTMMLAACGVSAAEAQRVLPQVIEAAQELYQTGVPDLRDKLCPGLPEILEEMARRKV